MSAITSFFCHFLNLFFFIIFHPSIFTLIKIALLNLENNFTQALNQAYNNGIKLGETQGYEKGKKDWIIEFPCHICAKPLYIPPNSDCHKAITTYLKDNRWGHANCNKQ